MTDDGQPERPEGTLRFARIMNRPKVNSMRRKPFDIVGGTIKNRKKNLVYRYVNDSGGNLEKALDMGFRFIDDAGNCIEDVNLLHTRRRDVAGKSQMGHPVYRYLMAMPKKFYEEDTAIIQERVDKRMGIIKRGQYNRSADDGRDLNDKSDQIVIKG